MEKIFMPITTNQLLAINDAIGVVDCEYLDGLQIEQIRKEDIDKIAILYQIIKRLDDVPKSRIEWLVDACGLELPDYDILCEKYDF